MGYRVVRLSCAGNVDHVASAATITAQLELESHGLRHDERCAYSDDVETSERLTHCADMLLFLPETSSEHLDSSMTDCLTLRHDFLTTLNRVLQAVI